MNQQQKQCLIHEEELCIGIDLNPQCDPQNKHCCLKCFTNPMKSGNIVSYKEANDQLQAVKVAYKKSKEDQIQRNLQVLQELQQSIQLVKNYYNQGLDLLLENLSKKITSLEEIKESLDYEIQLIDIDEYFVQKPKEQENNIQEFSFKFQEELDKMTLNTTMMDCKEKLATLDCQTIKIIPPEQLFQAKSSKYQQSSRYGFPCPVHPENKVEFFDLNQQAKPANRLCCDDCINERQGPFTSFSKMSEKWENYKSQIQDEVKAFEKQIRQEGQIAFQYVSEFQENCKKIVIASQQNLQNKWIVFLRKQESQINMFKLEWNHLSQIELCKIVEILSQPKNNNFLQTGFENDLKKYKQEIYDIVKETFTNIDQYQELCLGNIRKAIGLKEKEQPVQKIDRSEIKYEKSESYQGDSNISQMKISLEGELNYQIFQQRQPVYQAEDCLVIQFDPKNQMMMAGCNTKIKIFHFDSGQLSQTQLLSEHQSNITALFVMNKSNQFVSGSSGCSIYVWKMNQKQLWQAVQKLKQAHDDRVNGIQINQAEDLMITCSDDQSIKVWMFKQKWIHSQTLKIHKNKVICISLNGESNRLVSCSNDQQIIISFQINHNEFRVFQILKGADIGRSISFIQSDIIIYQRSKGGYVDILALNEQGQKFEMLQQIKIDEATKNNEDTSYFPIMLLSKDKQIIVCKQSDSLYFIKFNNAKQFNIEGKIKLQSKELNGSITADGKYLVTWDKQIQQFQVFKQQIKLL